MLMRATKKVSAAKRLFELNNMLEDLEYNEQQALLELHILPADYDEQDYYDLLDVLKARPKDKRPVDPMDWLQSLGIL